MDTENEPIPATKRSLGRAILGGMPTVIVILSLAAVGWWGHRTGWTAPTFASLTSRGPAPAEDWCDVHNVQLSRCIACNPALAGESAADWCKEHGVAESKCTICHPEILTTGVAGDWCREHGVPESSCTLCHPEIAQQGVVAARATDVVVSDTLGAARKPAGPVRDPATCQTHALKVQFASPQAVEKAGIRLGSVIERPMAAAIAIPGEVDYDRRRFAQIPARVAGILWRVEKDLGDSVREGDVLAVLDSAEVGKAKADLLQARAALDVGTLHAQRLERSVEAGFRTEVERVQADANVREAQIRLFHANQALLNLGLPLPIGAPDPDTIARLGLPDAVLAQLPAGTPSANLLPILAPFEGIVVARAVAQGVSVEPGHQLFALADTRRMWVTMDLPQADATRVALDAPVSFRPDGAADAVTGRVNWISTAVDEMTRTVKVRADVANEAGALRAHMFGRARIVIRTSPTAIAVPSEAVQWEGCCHVVFVRLTDEVFQTRKVRIGTRDAAYTEVLVGLLPGEVVVTRGSHVLKSEILKSNLGAGCCGDDR